MNRIVEDFWAVPRIFGQDGLVRQSPPYPPVRVAIEPGARSLRRSRRGPGPGGGAGSPVVRGPVREGFVPGRARHPPAHTPGEATGAPGRAVRPRRGGRAI